MKNLKDAKTTIYPSTTRGGKQLPSSSALDSPSILSKLATPKPLLLLILICRMLLMMPLLLCMILMMKLLLCLILLCHLVNFLMNNLLGVRENENIETDNIDESDDEDSPPGYELPVVPEGYVLKKEAALAILACKDRCKLKRLLATWK